MSESKVSMWTTAFQWLVHTSQLVMTKTRSKCVWRCFQLKVNDQIWKWLRRDQDEYEDEIIISIMKVNDQIIMRSTSYCTHHSWRWQRWSQNINKAIITTYIFLSIIYNGHQHIIWSPYYHLKDTLGRGHLLQMGWVVPLSRAPVALSSRYFCQEGVLPDMW